MTGEKRTPLTSRLGWVRLCAGLVAVAGQMVLIISDLIPLDWPASLRWAHQMLIAAAVLAGVAALTAHSQIHKHKATIPAPGEGPWSYRAMAGALSGVQWLARRVGRGSFPERVEVRTAAFLAKWGYVVWRQSVIWVVVGSSVWGVSSLIQLATQGTGLPVLFGETLLGVGTMFGFTGMMVLYGLWRARLAASTRYGGMPDPDGVQRARLTLVSGGAFVSATFLFVMLIAMDIANPQFVAPYVRQSLMAMAAMPLVVGLIAYEQQRGTEARRAERYMLAWAAVALLLVLVESISYTAAGNPLITSSWMDYLLTLIDCVGVTGALLRYSIWLSEFEVKINQIADEEMAEQEAELDAILTGMSPEELAALRLQFEELD
ncbi:hypothetical protein AB0M43_38175 [Longispora sp. NPDC051575]|uniref:hypothetical protein n=1 Tax=Longispora sp. NPDC051575 TaxID=3154943 RepID=UPI003423E483